MAGTAPSSSRWEQALLHAWSGRGWLALGLWPVSMFYRGAVEVRRVLYRLGICHTYRLPALVVVVGNIVAGGAGKTPAVIALVRHCLDRGWAVGVVSRGYGRHSSTCIEVETDSPVESVGDEPKLIKYKTGVPVFVGADRTQAGLALLAAHPGTQIIVCDDGLQHLGLARDVEICMFDDRGVGNGFLMPAGPLREPFKRNSRASVAGNPGTDGLPTMPRLILHSGAAPAFPGFRGVRTLCAHGVKSDGQTVALDSLGGSPIAAVAAIAQPQAFFNMLRSCGVSLEHTWAMPDHYDFANWSSPLRGAFTLLCTEKDAFKLWRVAPDAIAVPMAFAPEPAFFSAFDRTVTPLIDRPVSLAHGHQTS